MAGGVRRNPPSGSGGRRHGKNRRRVKISGPRFVARQEAPHDGKGETASGDPSSASDVRQLNLQLLRLLPRFPLLGSPLYLDAEERLIDLLLPVLRGLIEHRPWLRRCDPDGLAKGVCFDLIFAWRGGAPLWFTHKRLWNLVRRHLAKEGKAGGSAANLDALPDGRNQDPGLAEEIERALRLAEEFRAGLGAEDRKLFDAWVQHAGRPGWKKACAVAAGRSPTWVTNHLERLRNRLRTRHHIADPDDFIDALQFYGPADRDRPPASRERERPEQDPPPRGPEPRPPRVDLAEVFGGEADLLELMRVHGDRAALTEEQIRRKLFGADPDGALDALLERALDRYLRWARGGPAAGDSLEGLPPARFGPQNDRRAIVFCRCEPNEPRHKAVGSALATVPSGG